MQKYANEPITHWVLQANWLVHCQTLKLGVTMESEVVKKGFDGSDSM